MPLTIINGYRPSFRRKNTNKPQEVWISAPVADRRLLLALYNLPRLQIRLIGLLASLIFIPLQMWCDVSTVMGAADDKLSLFVNPRYLSVISTL